MRERLAERIRAEFGLDPPGWLLDARLKDRARARAIADQDYTALAASDGEAGEAERQALASLLRVGETRFFRHRAQMTALSRRVLPERAALAQRANRPLRVWSAGCASGEEAYTLAMLLDTHGAPWKLLATDLSHEAIDQARAARYPADRTGDVPPDLRDRYLTADGAMWLVRPTLRDQVRFQRHNLRDDQWPTGFDLIFCRNVLIYFEAQAREQVLTRLAGSLLEAAYLFLGYSETLRDQEAHFEALHDEDLVLYRKRVPHSPVDAAQQPQISRGPRAGRPVTAPDAARTAGSSGRGAATANAPHRSDSAANANAPHRSDPAANANAPYRSDPAANANAPHRSDPAANANAPHRSDPAANANAPHRSDPAANANAPYRSGAASSANASSRSGSAANANATHRSEIVRLEGEYGDGGRLAEEVKAVVGRPGAVIDLDGATFLDDSAARVLRRARMAAPGLVLRASKPAIRRWLVRHGLTWIGHE